MTTENLIELVKKYSILYCKDHESYTHTAKKGMIWKTIATQLDLEHDVAKRKWRHLRDSYIKHLRALSSSTEQKYNAKYKNWPWARQMEFLKPFVTKQNNSGAESMEHVECDAELATNFADFENHEEIKKEENEERGGESGASTSRKRKSRSKIIVDDSADNVKDARTDCVFQETNMDSIDLLFLSYAKTLKTFSEETQAVTKMKIAEIIGNMEIYEVRRRNGHETNTPPMFSPTHSNHSD